MSLTSSVSVVMPAHNEEDYLEASVREVVAGLRSDRRALEVLVVENGSSDGTRAVADALAAELTEVHVHSLPAADYGRALRTGLLAATGDVVVDFDVDYYDIDFATRAIELLGPAPAAAIVVGSKRARGARDSRSWPRRLVTWGFSTVLRLGFRSRVSDTHGMKALLRARVEPFARRCRFDADLFDTELVIRAERAGLAVGELPVTVEERRPSRTSIARRVLRSLVGLARLRVALWRERRDPA
jgi:glycosyltransferase involved in cell wall biosynthesis